MDNARRLESGLKVAIIGGGPAGSFFALYLLKFAGDKGIRPEITIYHERDFNDLGPKGCKGCAGIPSPTLTRNLQELNLKLPEEIIRAKIEHYALHSPYASISIANPEEGVDICSVYRGGGPRISHFENHISFDEWLLEEARRQGVNIENKRVSSIYLGQRPTVEVAGSRLEFGLVVLASGVNTKPITVVGGDYVRPKTRTMAVAELHAGADEVQSRLGKTAHAFLFPHSDLIFGTLVPKGPFINVSLLSTGKHPVSITEFLKNDMVRSVLPEHFEYACNCQPRAAITSAHNYYADNFVAIGDAVVSRLYKDGIGFALLTARQAARVVAYHGISGRDFERYYQPFCKKIDRDNRWGRLLFSVNDKAKDSPTFLLTQGRLIVDEQNNTRSAQPFTKAAWGMFTGSYQYSTVARLVLNPVSLARLGWSLVLGYSRRMFRRNEVYPKRIHVGSRKILILGSGFGGTYTLRHLVRSLNQNEHVETTMVSDENFFLFTPLLHEVALGGIETRHLAYPIRRLHWRDRFNFIQAKVEKIDLNAHKVATTMGTLDFDYLVLALGSVTDMSGLKDEGGNVFVLKTLQDSISIRNNIIEIFERASAEKDISQQKPQLTFVIAGAGYVGVQVATGLSDFIHKNFLRYYKTIPADSIKIILVDVEPEILAQMDKKMSAYVAKQLKRMDIEVRLQSRVTRVWKDRVEINNDEIVPTVMLIWAAGIISNPRVADLDVTRDNIGRVLVDEYLELPGFPGVYALGDCAHFENPASGQPIPPRAHTTVRQAKIAAGNILARIRGKDRKPYRHSDIGIVVSLGSSRAVLKIYGVHGYGLPARIVWLVAYSLLVTGLYNRVRVLVDWSLSLIFGRDITFIKMRR